MGPPSSGGSTVGETLNILSHTQLSAADPVAALHEYLEASRLAFADRNRYVGDPDYLAAVEQLLSRRFATQRACLLDPWHAAPGPVPPGRPDGDYHVPAGARISDGTQREGPNTTNVVTSDRWGNVVVYTLTIEQTGGSGIVVPGRGFVLNNELTDFNFALTQETQPDPNLPGAGKRPRSSLAPLKARGHQFSTNPEIGTATGLEFFHSGRVVAARRAGAPWWRQCSGGASPLIARDAMRADRGGERRTATGSRRKHDRQGAISDDAQDQLPLAVFGGPLVAQWDWFSGETTRRRLRYTRVS